MCVCVCSVYARASTCVANNECVSAVSSPQKTAAPPRLFSMQLDTPTARGCLCGGRACSESPQYASAAALCISMIRSRHISRSFLSGHHNHMNSRRYPMHTFRLDTQRRAAACHELFTISVKCVRVCVRACACVPWHVHVVLGGAAALV